MAKGDRKGFDVKFQHDVVSQAMKDPLYRQQAIRIIEGHHFESQELEWLWGKVRTTPAGEVISKGLIASLVRAEMTDPDKALEYIKLARKVISIEPTHARASLEELRKFVTYRTLHGGIEKAIKSLERGDVDTANDALYRAARVKSDTLYESEDWVNGMEQRFERRKKVAANPDLQYRCPTGVSRLDEVLGGGLKPKDFMIMGALTGVGKSHSAIQAAYQSAIRGIHTVLIDTENGLDLEFARLDAKFMNAASDLVEAFDLTRAELDGMYAKLARVKERLSGMLMVVHTSPRNASIQTIEQSLDDYAIKHGVEPKFCVVDCGDHIKPIERNKEKRHDTANAFYDMKSIADERNIAMFATAQLSKQAQDKLATGEDLSEAYEKARIATHVVTQNESRSEVADGKQRWLLAKNRGGKGSVVIPVLVDKSRSHFEYDPDGDRVPSDDDEGEDE